MGQDNECNPCGMKTRIENLEEDSRRNQSTHKEFYNRFEAIGERMARNDERYTQIIQATSEIKQPLRIFDYVERTAAPKTPVQASQAPAVDYVTHAKFDALAAEIEALKARKCTCSKKAVKEDENNG